MKNLPLWSTIAIAFLSFALQDGLSLGPDIMKLKAQTGLAAAQEGSMPDEKGPYNSPEELAASEDKSSSFPIEVSFRLPRTFGFHLGDEIKLVMVINARPGTVVDLVNLPRKGEGHGPFEIKDFKIKSAKTKTAISYEVDYVIQAFKPIFAVDKLVFPPLEILYADGGGRDSSGGVHNYRSLVSQPLPIAFSRTATYIGPMKDIKNPLDAGWWLLILASLAVGFLTTGFSSVIMARRYMRKRRIDSGPKELTPYERAMQKFNAAQEAYYFNGGDARQLVSSIGGALRSFLTETYGVNASSKTATQLNDTFKGNPNQVEIVHLLAMCEDVVYGGFEPGPTEVDRALRQYLKLINENRGAPKGNGHGTRAQSPGDAGKDDVLG